MSDEQSLRALCGEAARLIEMLDEVQAGPPTCYVVNIVSRLRAAQKGASTWQVTLADDCPNDLLGLVEAVDVAEALSLAYEKWGSRLSGSNYLTVAQVKYRAQ